MCLFRRRLCAAFLTQSWGGLLLLRHLQRLAQIQHPSWWWSFSVGIGTVVRSPKHPQIAGSPPTGTISCGTLCSTTCSPFQVVVLRWHYRFALSCMPILHCHAKRSFGCVAPHSSAQVCTHGVIRTFQKWSSPMVWHSWSSLCSFPFLSIVLRLFPQSIQPAACFFPCQTWRGNSWCGSSNVSLLGWEPLAATRQKDWYCIQMQICTFWPSDVF